MATLTITEALVKLKLTAKKIVDAQAKLHIGIVSTKGSNTVPPGFKSQDEFRSEIKSRIDTVTGLIRYRDKLKNSIILSNAKTNVVIDGKTMTVAEAIEFKQSVALKRGLYEHLNKHQTILNDQVNKNNANLDARADEYITKLFQGAVAGEEERRTARENWVNNNKAFAVTDDTLKKTVEHLGEEISNFMAEVDTTLSVANAKTVIEIVE